MAERKLRLAVPKGKWLIHPYRWSVSNILEHAGLGEYYRDGNYTSFSSFDPEIETTVFMPRDIPRVLSGNYDLGITGRDLMEDSKRLNLEEVCDLKCSYVDFVYATTPEKLQQLQDRIKKSNKIVKVKCITEYPDMALRFFKDSTWAISKAVYPIFPEILSFDVRGMNRSAVNVDLRYQIKKVDGTSEVHLIESEADIIFEVIATGKSQREKGIRVLKKVYDSSARLYLNTQSAGSSFGFVHFRDNPHFITDWKEGKVLEVKRRIEDVVKDIEKHCQVNFEVNYGKRSYIGKGGGVLVEVCDELENLGVESIQYDLKGNYLLIEGISNKRDLDKIRGLIQKIRPRRKKWDISRASAFELKSLFAYCPLSNLICEGNPKYPCCDSSALRPEHRKQATIFNFEPGKFEVNPQYAPLFRAG